MFSLTKPESRILIYGAGAIGSLYAVLFWTAGYDVSVYARGSRQKELKKKGLLYQKKHQVRRADVHVMDRLDDDDIYDFIFLTMRGDQAEAVREMKVLHNELYGYMRQWGGEDRERQSTGMVIRMGLT